MRRWLILLLGFGLPLAGLLYFAPPPGAAFPPPGEPDPATMPLQLRPGGFFPEGFPLEGRVRLLSSPVAEAGARTRIRIEYTVGAQPLEPGMSLEICPVRVQRHATHCDFEKPFDRAIRLGGRNGKPHPCCAWISSRTAECFTACIRRASLRGATCESFGGTTLYQRRAAIGLREGSLAWEGNDTKLVEVIHRDQAFEEFTPELGRVRWKSAAVSGDRDGLLLELGQRRTGVLRFEFNDPEGPGAVRFDIPLDQLHRDGFVHHTLTFQTQTGNVDYMERMGLKPSFTIEADLVDRNGPMDLDFTFQDQTPPKPGDYYYLRVEQMDTNKAWSSPVWVN